MPTKRLAVALSLLVTYAGHLAGQVPTAELGKRLARSKYTLGSITAAHELGDGRIVVSDVKEGVFRVVDLGKGNVGLIGRQGDDAGMYRRASTIVHLPGDSLGLFDVAGRQLLHLGADGTLGGVTLLPSVNSGRLLGQLVGGDESGNLYFNVLERYDSAAKAMTGTPGMTSLTRLASGARSDELVLAYRSRRDDQVARVNGMVVFPFRDAIAVRHDGLIARVSADSYLVTWFRDGKETGRTDPIAYTPIAISADEQKTIKDSIVNSIRNGLGGNGNGATRTMSFSGPPGSMGTPMSTGGPGGTATTYVMGNGAGSGGAPIVVNGGSMPISGGPAGPGMSVTRSGTDGSVTTSGSGDMQSFINKMVNQPYYFPDVRPAITATAATAMFDAGGNLWVARERARNDAVPHYDVIAEGKGLVRKVNLPVGTRLVGFGKGFVYLARVDNGSEWLERYAMPE